MCMNLDVDVDVNVLDLNVDMDNYVDVNLLCRVLNFQLWRWLYVICVFFSFYRLIYDG
jgi:hypothetical protein